MKAAILIVALAGATVNAQDLIAGWNFNAGVSSGTTATFPIAASAGTGSATSNFVSTNLVNFTGTTLNAAGTDVAGNDLGLQNGTSGANNGAFLQFSFDTTSYEDIAFSAAIRRTSTGFNTLAFQVSNDGVNFTNAGSILPEGNSTYAIYTLDLSSFAAIENTSTAFVRVVFSGGSTSSAAGNVRFDNVQFTGTLIPAPASMALLGLGGLAAARRRRA